MFFRNHVSEKQRVRHLMSLRLPTSAANVSRRLVIQFWQEMRCRGKTCPLSTQITTKLWQTRFAASKPHDVPHNTHSLNQLWYVERGEFRTENLNLNVSHWCCLFSWPVCVSVAFFSLHRFFSLCRHLWQIYSLPYPLGGSQEEEAHFCCKLNPWFILCLRTAGHRCTSDVITSQLFTYGAAASSKLTPEKPGGSRGSSRHNGLWQLLNHISQGLCGSYGWPRAMCHAGLR